MQTEQMVLSCYGVEVRVSDATGLALCQRLRETLPPELDAPGAPAEAVVAYAVTAASIPEATDAAVYLITCDGLDVFAATTEEEVFWWLRHDIDQMVARRSPHLLFVHAGVVGWRGVAIVIPGRRSTGKSTLVAELVRRGAVYYSDAFAALDAAGKVHPYRGSPVLGDDQQPQELRLVREDVPAEPLPIGLIVDSSYQPGLSWQPTIVRSAHAALPLVDSTIVAREDAARLVDVTTQIAPTVVTLRGPRPEAAEVAGLLLDLVDDAFVSHALDAAGNGSSRLTDDLASAAEIRLRSQAPRPVSPPRRLITARYVRLPDFLSRAEHQRLLDHALACEEDFQESRIVGGQGEGKVDYEARRSRTLSGARLEEVWDMFDRRLRASLAFVRQQLGMPWFPLGQVERQLTVHGSGGFFVPHLDTGHPRVANRRVSCVYYFHQNPPRYAGGELRLYDTWITPTGTTGAATCTTLPPLDNSVVFFPSSAFHEVCPVYPETDAFGDCRFAVTIWFREAEQAGAA